MVVLDTIRRVLLPSATRCRLGELAEQQQQPCLCVYTGHERRPARQILWVCTLSPARRNPEQANGIQFVRDDGGRHGGLVLIEYAAAASAAIVTIHPGLMKLAFTSGFAGHVVNDVIRRRIMETVGYGRKREAGRNVGYYVSSCIGFVRLVCGNVWGYFRVGGVHSKQIKLRDGVAYCFSLLSSSSSSLPPSPSFFLVVIKIHVDGPSSDHAVTRGKPPPQKKRVLPPAIHHGRECELRATFFPSRVGSDKRTRDCAPLVIVLLRLYGFVVVVISSC